MTNTTTPAAKLSAVQKDVLRRVAICGRVGEVATTPTIRALLGRGLISYVTGGGYAVTEAGKAALA